MKYVPFCVCLCVCVGGDVVRVVCLKHAVSTSDVCHPRCVFKLYGEVNSVKNTTINTWLIDDIY